MRFRYRVYFKERAPFFLTSNGTLGRWLKEKKKRRRIGREALTAYNKTPLINRVIDFVSKNRKKRRELKSHKAWRKRWKCFKGCERKIKNSTLKEIMRDVRQSSSTNELYHTMQSCINFLHHTLFPCVNNQRNLVCLHFEYRIESKVISFLESRLRLEEIQKQKWAKLTT